MPEEVLSESAIEWLAVGKAAFTRATSRVEALRKVNAGLVEELKACEKKRWDSAKSREDRVRKDYVRIEVLLDENDRLKQKLEDFHFAPDERLSEEASDRYKGALEAIEDAVAKAREEMPRILNIEWTAGQLSIEPDGASAQELLDTTVMSLRSLLGYCDCYPDKRESMKTGIIGILDSIVKGEPQGKGGG